MKRPARERWAASPNASPPQILAEPLTREALQCREGRNAQHRETKAHPEPATALLRPVQSQRFHPRCSVIGGVSSSLAGRAD